MFNQLRIGFDVDDVVNNFMNTTLEIYNERNDAQLNLEMFHEYGITSCVERNIAEKIWEIFYEHELWERMCPAPHSASVIKDFVQRGHQVYFVSACDARTHEDKSRWLCANYPFVPIENHIYTYNKGLLKLDLLIDDNPEHFKGGAFARVLVDKPWNREASEFKYEYKIKDLSELSGIVTKEEKI